MSRSYKKPIIKDKDKVYHKLHNRKVRHQPIDLDEVAPREKKLFRKQTDSWDITDWIFHVPENDEHWFGGYKKVIRK